MTRDFYSPIHAYVYTACKKIFKRESIDFSNKYILFLININ